MKWIREYSDRILALALIASLAACEPGGQSAQEPDAAQAAESAASANDQGAAEPDRFANMFVSEVTDTFNPGLPIGSRFPAIKALYQGDETMNIDRFIRDRGAIFIAARSVDW